MTNYQKLQAIQGILNDVRERMYFYSSAQSKQEWIDEDFKQQYENAIHAIYEILNDKPKNV